MTPKRKPRAIAAWVYAVRMRPRASCVLSFSSRREAERERAAAAKALRQAQAAILRLIKTKGDDDETLTYDEVIEQVARIVGQRADAAEAKQ